MQLIRCTSKLLRELRAKPVSSVEAAGGGLLGQWHANLLHIDRRKSLLFVNDRTLFNFIVPDVNRAQIQSLPELFRSHLSCVLSEERVPEGTKHSILAEYDEIQIAKSSDRSVLGSANDLAFHYKYSILEAGGVHSWRVPAIIRQLNRMPLQAIAFKFPIEELANRCGFAA
jgi:hypothetical protein